MSAFKLLLLNDGGVGEAFVKAHATGQIDTRSSDASGVEIYPIVFQTNKSPIKFNVYDLGKCWKLEKLDDEYFVQGQCAIILFYLSSRITYKNVPNWHRDLTSACGDIPIVLSGHKVNTEAREVKAKKIMFSFHRKKKLPYYDHSTKSKHDTENPFLFLARKLTNDSQLRFVETHSSSRGKMGRSDLMRTIDAKSPKPFATSSNQCGYAGLGITSYKSDVVKDNVLKQNKGYIVTTPTRRPLEPPGYHIMERQSFQQERKRTQLEPHGKHSSVHGGRVHRLSLGAQTSGSVKGKENRFKRASINGFVAQFKARKSLTLSPKKRGGSILLHSGHVAAKARKKEKLKSIGQKKALANGGSSSESSTNSRPRSFSL